MPPYAQVAYFLHYHYTPRILIWGICAFANPTFLALYQFEKLRWQTPIMRGRASTSLPSIVAKPALPQRRPGRLRLILIPGPPNFRLAAFLDAASREAERLSDVQTV
jgi:hypothetical protein